MRIYGVDFTSTPSAKKPITVARCELAEDGEPRLILAELARIPGFDAFRRSLRHPGPWVAGMDFPFGQPRKLLEHLARHQDWPDTWPGVVRHAASLSRQELVDLLDLYRAARPKGDKEHLRETDRRARSLSPMKIYGVPLAKMFHEGAPRLEATPCNVPPVRPTDDDRTVLEVYPGLAARSLLGGKKSYKSDVKRKQTPARRQVRKEILAALQGERCREVYGFPLELDRFRAASLLDDPTGDLLDAVLAAVQAAWAWRQGDGWGIPEGCDPLEGWIVDPATRGEEA